MNHIEVLKQHYTTKNVSSTDTGINCPFCPTIDRGYNLWVSHKAPKGYKYPQYHCWRCGDSGSIYKFFSIQKIEFDSESYGYVELSNESLYDELSEELSSSELKLPEEYRLFSKDSKSLIEKKALDYLIKRNIDLPKIERYKLGFCSIGKYANRIIIPMFDDNNKLIFFAARSFYDKADIKIKNVSEHESGVGKETILYNINNNIDKDTVIINEGPFDTMSTDGIGLLGKHPSAIQLNKIKKLKASNIILMLDSDATSYSYEIAELLHNYKNVYICELPYGDPNSIAKKDLDIALSNKKLFNSLEYLTFKLRSRNDKMPNIKM